MREAIEAWPLHWPTHRKRTPGHQQRRAKFHRVNEYGFKSKEGLVIADIHRVLHELRGLGGDKIIISSNLELRNDGLPRSNQREPDDSGVAVYFQLNRQPHCLSCDTWDRVADNLAAIAKYVEAQCGQLRWGMADAATMLAGFKALANATEEA